MDFNCILSRLLLFNQVSIWTCLSVNFMLPLCKYVPWIFVIWWKIMCYSLEILFLMVLSYYVSWSVEVFAEEVHTLKLKSTSVGCAFKHLSKQRYCWFYIDSSWLASNFRLLFIVCLSVHPFFIFSHSQNWETGFHWKKSLRMSLVHPI